MMRNGNCGDKRTKGESGTGYSPTFLPNCPYLSRCALGLCSGYAGKKRLIAVTKILIADDHNFYRAQLRTLLESVQNWQVCAEAVNGVEVIEMHSYFDPDITVMDFNMPEVNGLLASREILRKFPAANILMLTLFASSQLATRAKNEGIKAFCSKTEMPCIIQAIESLLRGETYFPESFAASA